MKKIYHLLPIILLAGIFFSSCEDDLFEPLVQNRTYLHFLNMYDGTPSVDIYLKSLETDGVVANGVSFLEGWPKGGYASLLTNAQNDTSFESADVTMRILEHNSINELIPENPFRLNSDIRSTISLIDSFGKTKVVKTIDIFEPAGDTSANIRFMNVNYGLLSVTLQSSDKSIVIDRLNFLNYSSFNHYKPGTYDFQFVDDVNGFVVETLPQVKIEVGKTYSFYLTQNGNTPLGGYETLSFNNGDDQ